MKKKIFLLLIILVVFLIIFILNFKIKYSKRETLESFLTYDVSSKSISNNSLSKNDILVELINYSNDNNELNFDIKISNKNNNLHSAIFNTLIYDKKYVIWNGIPEIKYNYYRNKLFKDFYGNSNYKYINSITLNSGPLQIINISPEDYSYLLYNIKIGLRQNYTESSNTYLTLIDLKYQNSGNSKYNSIDNTDFKFNIAFSNN